MSRSKICRIASRQEDNSVAEIVGAILLFAVVITLFTSFMVWYIPAQTTTNEVHYEQQTKTSMGSLISQMHNSVPNSGDTLSQNIAMGISGVSIFSPAKDTQFYVLPNDRSFSANMTFSIALNLTNSTGSLSTHYFNETYLVKGIMASNGNTEYISSINYVIEDGALFQNYGGNQPSNGLGPLPVGIVNNSGQYGLSLSIFGVGGQSVSYSSTQSQILNLLVGASQYHSYVNGTSASISGSQYSINSITLDNLNYTINGTLVNAWNYEFFSSFNSTSPGYNTVTSLPGWNFTGLPFRANISGTEISVLNTQNVNLYSITSEYVVFSAQ